MKAACQALIVPVLLCGVAARPLPAADGVVVRVDDGANATCINPGTDRVWFTLRRLITTQRKGWFKKDSSVAIVIKARVTPDPLPEGGPLTFPLLAEAKFDGVPSTSQVSVPIEYTVVSGLNLRQGDVRYTGMGAEVTLINKQGRTTLGSALDALATVTASGKLPVPSSPILAGASYLAKFANEAIDKDIKSNNENQALAGSLAFNFDPNGQCSQGDFEKSGTKAFVFADGDKAAPGYVDTAKVNEHCWAAELSPAFVLKATPMTAGLACTDPSYKPKLTAVANNYTAFFLNRQVVGSPTGLSILSEHERAEAVARCRANGIVNVVGCPGAN